MNTMRVLSPEEIKAIELKLLSRFADYCDEKGLKYYLIYGTLLGAVRHKDFIPWDDDIDVCMPREDYLHFIELQKQNKTFDYCCVSNNTSSQPFIKIMDLSTKIDQDTLDDTEVSHLWVDVFPLDYMPDDEKEYMKAYRYVRFLRFLMVYSVARIGAGTNLLRKIIKIPMIIICKAIGRYRLARRIDNYCMNLSPKSNHVNSLCWGARGIEAYSNISIFADRVRMIFEGEEFWAPVGWHEYLSSIYGDYMKLPPESQRVGHHMVAYINEEESHA